MPFDYYHPMRPIFILLLLLFTSFSSWAQRNELNAGIITGTVRDVLTNETLPGVSVNIIGTTLATKTDTAGVYRFKNIKPGLYNIQFSYVGYKKKTQFDVQVGNARPAVLDVSLEMEASALGEVKINAPLFIKPVESPVSLRTVGATEIKRVPGGNRDISRAIQSLPGVAAPVSFRNDIIIRGGSPSENRFYLDGVEIPNINHFTTQGASGGPVGMINVDFIKEVDFYSGAFPANRGNMLSSVFEFRQKDGRSDKFSPTLTLGATDLAATLEGPLGDKTTFLTSYRYSYLQGLFKVLGLPFLPAYQDYQFKIKHKINPKNELTLIGLGAIDRFKLNLSSADDTEASQYLVDNLPVNEQDNYTVGLTYKNFRAKGNSLLVISRNYLNNRAEKFQNNDESKLQTLDYQSKEIENKIRFENNSLVGPYKINFGVGVETGEYNTNTTQILPLGSEIYTSAIDLVKYGLFAQISRSVFADKVNLSFGLRADANTFNDQMNNLAKTISPRLSATYNINEKLSINANAGIYYQMPTYTLLGYRQGNGPLLNTNAQYIQSQQAVLGFEYNTLEDTRFTIEGFYKYYDRYPMVRELGVDVPLANLGADFGVNGNRQLTGFTQGRSYGLELLTQRRLKKGFYGIASLTLFRSEFQDNTQTFVQTSWNNRYIISMTGGKILPKNWEIGTRFRFSGGSPYTPYDLEASSLKSNFDTFPQGISDFNRLNQNLLANFYQLDLRIDKKYPFKNFSLNVFFDVQNVTNLKYQQRQILVLDRDANGQPQTDPNNANRYKTKLINDPGGTVLPTLGIIFEL
ncbi:MAG: hypothetical protein RLZ47_207 [Bacteroidota bacterium]